LQEQIAAPNKRDSQLFVKQKNTTDTLDVYKKKYPTEYKIAKTIYDAKGIVYDDEYKAVKAIKSIKDKTQFDIVQKILQWMTNGQGLATFLTSTNYLTGTLINVSSGTALQGLELTVKYLNSIISHLNKIKASKQTVDILTKKLDAVMKQWKLEFQAEKDNPLQPGALPGLAWDTWMKRSLKDPEFKHQYLMWMSVASSFIPGIGLMLSSGIMLADAAAYYQEGNRLEAGYSAIFALLPAALKGVSKIPFIQKLGARGMAALAEKLATSKYSLLQKTEIYAIQELVKYKDLIKRDLETYFKARVKNELSHALTTASSTGAKRILRKIGNGTLKTSVLGTKTAAQLGTFFISQDVADKTWDKIYNKMGYEKLDYKDQSEKEAQDVLKLINQLKNP
jgi:hypothetical protein